MVETLLAQCGLSKVNQHGEASSSSISEIIRMAMQHAPNSGTSSRAPKVVADQPKLSLPAVTNSKGYTFPTIYSFPPFYTYEPLSPSFEGPLLIVILGNRKQPNEQSWSHQSTQWKNLILDYSRHHRQFRIDLTEASCQSELFKNKAIDSKSFHTPSAVHLTETD